MARRDHRNIQSPKIRVTFEPSRLSPACVAQAYEHVAPISRRTTAQPASASRAGGERSQPVESPPAGQASQAG